MQVALHCWMHVYIILYTCMHMYSVLNSSCEFTFSYGLIKRFSLCNTQNLSQDDSNSLVVSVAKLGLRVVGARGLATWSWRHWRWNLPMVTQRLFEAEAWRVSQPVVNIILLLIVGSIIITIIHGIYGTENFNHPQSHNNNMYYICIDWLVVGSITAWAFIESKLALFLGLTKAYMCSIHVM